MLLPLIKVGTYHYHWPLLNLIEYRYVTHSFICHVRWLLFIINSGTLVTYLSIQATVCLYFTSRKYIMYMYIATRTYLVNVEHIIWIQNDHTWIKFNIKILEPFSGNSDLSIGIVLCQFYLGIDLYCWELYLPAIRVLKLLLVLKFIPVELPRSLMRCVYLMLIYIDQMVCLLVSLLCYAMVICGQKAIWLSIINESM